MTGVRYTHRLMGSIGHTVGPLFGVVSLVFSLVLNTSAMAARDEIQAPLALARVTVDAGHPWVASGLTVGRGDRLVFKTEGTIRWGAQPDQVAGPNGKGKAGKLGPGGLIGRIGSTGRPFAIGASEAPIVMKKKGVLFLGINDFVFGDNDGAFVVTIMKAP